MSSILITGIAFSLSFDAFAVSLSSGCALNRPTLSQSLKVGLWFGIFQGIMPVLGWMGGAFFRSSIQTWSHWLAFGLLSIIGSKMIYDGYKSARGCPPPGEDFILHPARLCLLAIATSIDAFAVGLSFAVLHYPILVPAMVIGVVTFVMSTIGLKAGESLYTLLEDKVEYAGGLILIIIGLKILMENLH